MKLTICIPTFNRANKVLATIETLIPQLNEEVELFVSDNASTDGTLDALKKYHEYISIQKHFENIGAERNMLSCITLGSGEYIWLLNDDDLVSGNSVSRVLNGIKNYHPIPLLWATASHIDLDSSSDPLSTNNDWIELAGDNFLQNVGCWITFCPSIIAKREHIINESFDDIIGLSLLPTALTLQSLAVENRVVVSRDRLIIPREGEPGRYDVFTIFTRNLRFICEKFSGKPFLRSSLVYIYKDSYYKVLDGRIHSWPISFKVALRLFRYGYRYKKFYFVYIPAIATRASNKLSLILRHKIRQIRCLNFI